jgi:signal peptidase I
MATATNSEKAKPAGRKAPAGKTQAPVRGFVAEWAWTILILVWATSFVAQVMAIPTSSMHDTLLTGDHLIVDKLADAPPGAVSRYLLPYREVKRGDIIVFRHPILLDENYVKRVIGVPGDHIKLVDKQLWLNGHTPNEPYAIHIRPEYDPYRDNFPANGPPDYFRTPAHRERTLAMLQDDVVNGELVVPPGNYFAMGDNRDNSEDSRYWGLVPRGNIIGKPAIILWSYNAPSADLTDYTVHHFIDLAEHFFTKTRWERTMRLVEGYPLQ